MSLELNIAALALAIGDDIRSLNLSRPMVGSVQLWAAPLSPVGWLFCRGQTLLIADYPNLYSVIGTAYGGDGVTNFGLPDLGGRSPVGVDAGTALGQAGGSATVTLSADNLPSHTHTASMSMTGLNATTNISVSTGTTGGALVAETNSTLTGTTAGTPAAAGIYLPAATAPTNPVNLGGVSTTVSGSGTVIVDASGGGNSFDNRSPYLGLNFIICVSGIVPVFN